MLATTSHNGELKQRRRRLPVQRLIKNEIRDCQNLSGSPMAPKTCYSYICNDGVQFQMKIRKISRRRPNSSNQENYEITWKKNFTVILMIADTHHRR